jgi:hypothetical protein
MAEEEGLVHKLEAPELSEEDQRKLRATLERLMDKEYLLHAFREMIQPIERFQAMRKDLEFFVGIHIAFLRVGAAFLTCSCPMMFNYAPPEQFLNEKIFQPAIYKVNELVKGLTPTEVAEPLAAQMEDEDTPIKPALIIAIFSGEQNGRHYLMPKVFTASWIANLAPGIALKSQELGEVFCTAVIRNLEDNYEEFNAMAKEAEEKKHG